MTQAIPFGSTREISCAIPAAVAHLQLGRILGYPTETVYGLGTAATTPSANALRKLKRRAAGKQFLLLAADMAMVDLLRPQWNRSARALAGEHWPGPLTLILRASNDLLPPEVCSGGTVAVRLTSHAGIAAVIRAYGAPITSTSANLPGEPPALSCAQLRAQLRAQFGGHAESGDLLLLDAGSLAPSMPSSVVDCSGDVPRLVRPGAISGAVLRVTAPNLELDE